MKKVMSIALSLVLVLGMIPAFAVGDQSNEKAPQLPESETSNQPEVGNVPSGTAGEKLKHYGFISGGTGGDLMEDSEFSREQLAKILAELSGKADEAAAFKGNVSFKDAKDIGKWALPYVAYAAEQGWLKGNEKNEFLPKEAVTGKALLTAMLRVLKYETKWETVVEDAAEVGFTAPEGDLTRGRAFETIWTVVSEVPSKGSDVPLGVELGKLEPEKPVPTELDFTPTASNLKEVKVEFNQEVDRETVKDANFVIKKGTSTIKAKATLLEGNTAVLTVDGDGLSNQGAYTLTVEKVKPVNGTEIAKTTKDFTAFDRDLPEAKEVKVTGPRDLKITFNEPIKTAGTIEIKQENTIVGNSTTVSGKTVSVKAYSNFIEGKNYVVKVTGFKDYADYANVAATLEFTYAKDETPPVASIVKAEQDYVVIDFDKPVNGLKKEYFYHTFNAWQSLGIYSDMEMSKEIKTSDSVNRVYIKFYDANEKNQDKNRPLPEGTVNVGISGAEIKDNWGNKLGDITLPVTIKSDTTQLAFETEVREENKILVKFNKAIQTTEISSKNFEVLDQDGKTISGLIVTVNPKDNKNIELTLNQKLAGKTVTLNVKNIRELGIAGTKIESETVMVEITDKTSPSVSRAYHNLKPVSGKNDEFSTKELIVQFSEGVDGQTALVASNYSLVYGTNLVVLTESVDFDNDNEKVKVQLTDAQAKELKAYIESPAQKTAPVKLQVINVKDLSGNVIKPIQQKVEGDVSSFKVKLESVKATAKNKLVITFNDKLVDLSEGSFLMNNGSDSSEFTLTQEYEGSKTVVTLENNKADFYNTKAEKAKLVINYNGFKDSYGSAVKEMDIPKEMKPNTTDPSKVIITAGIEDKIAPEIVEDSNKVKAVKVYDDDSNGSLDTLDIQFTEPMAKQYISLDKFTVDGFTIKEVVTDNNDATIRLKLVEQKDGAGQPLKNTTQDQKLIIGEGLRDVKNNLFLTSTSYIDVKAGVK